MIIPGQRGGYLSGNPQSGRLVKITSNAQSITLPGLDGDADGSYYIEGFIHIATSSGGTTLSWQPNGLTTNQEGQANSGVGAYSDAALLNFTGAINLADAPLAVTFRTWFHAQKTVGGVACWRSHRTRAEITFATGTVDGAVYDGQGSWQETATNLTSLVLYASSGAHILAGSQVRWWPTGYRWDA